MAQDDTFLIGLVLVVVALVLVAIIGVIVMALAIFFLRRSRAEPTTKEPKLAGKSLPTSMPIERLQKEVEATVDFKGGAKPSSDEPKNGPLVAEVRHDETRPVPIDSAPPPIPDHLSSAGPLLGFFDDEPSTQDSARDTATELFQRGTHSFDWDDAEEEDGATEVFSSHHMEELGEFTIEEDESQ